MGDLDLFFVKVSEVDKGKQIVITIIISTPAKYYLYINTSSEFKDGWPWPIFQGHID